MKSPAEISTVFLVLTIGFYVFLFWRSQIHSQTRYLGSRRRISDKSPAGPMALNRPFEDDRDKDHATTH